MQQILNLGQTKKCPFLEHFLICYSIMVREIAVRWNPIYNSILVIYQKLTDMPDFINRSDRKVQ
jgi:hypothetical protein